MRRGRRIANKKPDMQPVIQKKPKVEFATPFVSKFDTKLARSKSSVNSDYTALELRSTDKQES